MNGILPEGISFLNPKDKIMNKKEIIEQKLSVLNPHILKVVDQSSSHKGHAGNPNGEGNSHFAVTISSDKLEGVDKLMQHRMINHLLKDEFASGLHALTIKILQKK